MPFNSYGYGFSRLKIQYGRTKGLTQNIDISFCNLSATALDDIYTGLGTGTGKTITVTGNPGVSGDTTSIATTKGWTVTG